MIIHINPIYFKCENQTVLKVHMSKARPEEKISEVVDDMMDAVAGLTPQVSLMKQLKIRVK